MLPAGAWQNMNKTEFYYAYGATVALSGSEAFVQLTDPVIISHFELLTDALLLDDIPTAETEIAALENLDAHFKLIHITNSQYDTIGFMEDREPGETGYKGWGAFLVNRESTGYVIYQAPHVFADMYTRDITLQAFYENPNAVAIQLTGAHRYANGDGDGDTWPDSDAAHDGECLFHVLTGYLAERGVSQDSRYWFVQLHGSADRPDEPDLVGSNCDHEPMMTADEPLVLIDDQIDIAGNILSGVWGWYEGPDVTQNGDYYLNGLGNLQRWRLYQAGVARSFLHYEMERTIRDHYAAGSGYGYDGINDLLTAIQDVLGSEPYVLPPTPTPAPTWTPEPTHTSTDTPTHTPTSNPTVTPTNTPTHTPTSAPSTPTPTVTPTNPPATETPVPTDTPVPTATSTPWPTATPTSIPTDTPTGTPPCVHHGDVTLDGTLSSADAQTAFYIVLGTVTPTFEESCAADCNGDGTVSAADSQLIFLAVLGSGSCEDPI